MDNFTPEIFACRYPGFVREYSIGQEICADKNKLEFDFLVIEGSALEKVRIGSDEKTATTLLFRKGDFFGCFGGDRSHVARTSIIAMSRMVVLRVPDHAFLGLLQNDEELAALFVKSLINVYHRITNKFCTMVVLTPAGRVIDFILKSCARDPSGETHITTQELAEAVSTTRQTVSKVISNLKREHLIETSYSRIKVLDFPNLLDKLNKA